MPGFTRTQVIEVANRRTENRGKSLDLLGEYLLALQEVCNEKRWWWRRKILSLSIVAGQSQYQLLDPNSVNAIDFQQMAKNGFKIFQPTGGQVTTVNPLSPFNCSWQCPEPVFDTDRQEYILAMQSQYPPAMPCRYFILGDGSTLTVDPVPDQNYPASIGYWAVPQNDDSNNDETVPLVPPPFHGMLIKRLELHIERYSMGEDPSKYEAVAREYGELLAKAQIYTQFAEGQVNDLRSHDHHDAVQSS